MLREPEVLAFAGDWHGNASWATRAVGVCSDYNVDTIVHTGDYGFAFTNSYICEVEKACRFAKSMLYFVDGNHDNHDFLRALPLDDEGFGILSDHVRFIPRGHRWQWWDLTWLGLGGAHSVDRPHRTAMIDWWPTEWITESEYAKAREGGPVDVMIAHDCPSGVDIPGITRQNGLKFFSAMELNNADEHRYRMRMVVDDLNPKLYVHGHYHTAYETRVDGTRFVGLSEDATTMQGNLWVTTNALDMLHGVQ